jgi:uridine kinase
MDIKTLQEVAQEINLLPTPRVIGISGFGGAGKSTLAHQLSTALNCSVVGVDDFQKPGAFDTDFSLWEIMDYSRLEKEVLIPFMQKSSLIRYGKFNAKEEVVEDCIEIKNQDTLIIEGVGLFRPELMQYFSYTIWIDIPLEEAISRGKKRDREEYQNPNDECWDGTWKKNDLEYYAVFEPDKKADIVISNT